VRKLRCGQYLLVNSIYCPSPSRSRAGPTGMPSKPVPRTNGTCTIPGGSATAAEGARLRPGTSRPRSWEDARARAGAATGGHAAVLNKWLDVHGAP
jgi:hypothetical protein